MTRSWDIRWLAAAIAGGAVAWCFVVAWREVLALGLILLLGVVAVIGSIVAWRRPAIIVSSLIIVVTIVYWMTTDLKILPDSAKFIKEALVLILFVRGLYDGYTRNTFARSPLDIPLGALVGVIVLSSIVNGSPFLYLLVGVRGLMQYTLVYYAVIWLRQSIGSREWLGIGLVALVMSLIQLPVGVLQLISARSAVPDVGGPAPGLGQDIFRGTVGLFGANDVGFVIVPAAFAILSLCLDRIVVMNGRRIAAAGVVLLLLFAVPILSTSRLAWLAVFLGVFGIWGLRILFNVRLLLAASVVVTLAVGLLDWHVSQIGRADIDAGREQVSTTLAGLVAIEGVIGSLTTPGYGIGISEWWRLTVGVVSDYATIPLLGLGPATGGSSGAVQLENPIYQKYFYNAFGGRELGLPPHLSIQVISTFAEYGPIGVLVLGTILARIGLFAGSLRLRDSSVAKTLGAMLIAQTLVFGILSFKSNVWEQQVISIWLWLLMGAAVAHFGISRTFEEEQPA